MAKQKFNFQPKINTSNTEETNSQSSATISQIESLAKKLENTNPKSVLDKFKIVPRHKLRSNKKNTYQKHSLESLKESILYYDVQQDISAVYLMEEDIYVIEAGHRRQAAIDLLINEFKDYEGDSNNERYQMYLKNIKKYEVGYVCKIIGTISEDVIYDYSEDTDLSSISPEVIDSEIRLHITNIESRNDDPVDRAKNINRLSKLYSARNRNLPRSERININETLAKELNLGVTQVKNYQNIGKLIPELQEEFANNKITLKEGSSYSQLTQAEQYNILELVRAGTKMSEDTIKALRVEKENLSAQLLESQKKLDALKEEVSKRSPSDLEQQDLSRRSPGDLEQQNLSKRSPGDLEQQDLSRRSLGDLEQQDLSKRSPGDLEQQNLSKRSLGNLEQQDLSRRSPGDLLDNDSSGVPGTLLEEKRIQELEQEIASLKEKENLFQTLTPENAQLVKSELELSLSLDQINKALQKTLLLFNNYKVLYNTIDTASLKLRSIEDITLEFQKLAKQLTTLKGEEN